MMVLVDGPLYPVHFVIESAKQATSSITTIFSARLTLEIDEVNEMLDHWCKRASRSRLPSFIRLIIDHPNSSRRDTCRRHTWGI